MTWADRLIRGSFKRRLGRDRGVMKKKTRTSVGITITLKARKLLNDEQVELALREVLEQLQKAA